MRGFGVFPAVLFSALATPVAAMAIAPQPTTLEAPRPASGKRAEKRRAMVAQSTPNWRSRGVQAKPKKRPNMRTISKRVRRKHRRAR